MDFGDPVEGLAQVAAAAGVLQERQRGLGDGQSVSDAPAPTTTATTRVRPRSRCDNTTVDQAHNPIGNSADNRSRPTST
ncbi:hypothetical protein ACGF7W_25295 [Streptomyces sp. NPDC048219]|uniref:hypothetical protein n=1 Tax=Streptomyces sp. NPDC048219 TaxID=3365517 RepID=UPI00371BDE93